MDTGEIVDRRGYDRVALRFPVEWADHYYEWPGECLNFGAGGVYVIGAKPLKPGKKLNVKLLPPHEAPLELAAKVAFATEDGMGLAFDVRAAEAYERAVDLFERLIARDTNLALKVKSKSRVLRLATTLFPTVAALSANACVNPAEKRVLGFFNDGRRLEELQRAIGEATWPLHANSVFALLERGVLTTNKGLAASPEDVAAGRAKAPVQPAVSTPSGPRPPQAEKYYQKGQLDLDANNPMSALTNFKLALMLAPGDPQILKLVQELEPKKPAR